MTVSGVQPTKYKLKAPEHFTKTNFVQNTYFDVCDLDGELEIYSVRFIRLDDDAIAKNWDFIFTIDDNTITKTGNSIDNNTNWEPYVSEPYLGLFYENYGVAFMHKSFALHCARFKIEARQTSALGANQSFEAYILYSKKE